MSSTQGPASEETPGPPAPTLCIPGPGEKIVQDFQVLVQKVGGRPEVLLIGETLEGQDIHSMMASFVKDIFSATCQPVHPGDALKEPSVVPCTIGGKQCQLIFFLCRASCLRGKQAELQKVLKEVKKFVQRSPCALVGVIMEPTKGEMEAARAQLLRLLRGIFPKMPRAHRRGKQAQGGGGKVDADKAEATELEDIEVEAEVYVPGHPRGNLAIMKAACRASEALAQSRGLAEKEEEEEEVSKDPLTIAGSAWAMTIFKGLVGTACTVGVLSVALWYLSEYGLIPLDKSFLSFLSFLPRL